jgi:NAD(P)-dependent dehydrogenase (short-subunit alcohol dehydrogenase family)
VCEALATAGGDVVAVDVNEEGIYRTIAALENTDRHLGLTLDVGKEADMETMVSNTLQRFGRIDNLVACAGILRAAGTSPKPLYELDPAEWDQVIDVNLTGTFLSNRAVLPYMLQKRTGNIINVSSTSGRQGRAFDSAYCASKFGIIGLSEALADEVRNQGVRVQVILPDAVETALWDQNGPIPMPSNALPPERIADFILFMLTLPEDTILGSPVIAPFRTRRKGKPSKPKR